MSGTKLFRTPDPSTVDSASTSFLSTLSMSPLILHRDTFNHNHFYHERSGSGCSISLRTLVGLTLILPALLSVQDRWDFDCTVSLTVQSLDFVKNS